MLDLVTSLFIVFELIAVLLPTAVTVLEVFICFGFRTLEELEIVYFEQIHVLDLLAVEVALVVDQFEQGVCLAADFEVVQAPLGDAFGLLHSLVDVRAQKLVQKDF